MWQPARLFLAAAAACLAVVALLAVHPFEMWIRLGRLQEDMIYRLLFCWLMGALGVTLLSAGVISEHVHRLIDYRLRPQTFLGCVLDAVYSMRGCAYASVFALPLLLWLVGRGVWTWTTDGYVEEHWSRIVLAGLIVFGLAQMSVSVLIVNILRFHTDRKSLRTADSRALSIRFAQKRVEGTTPTSSSRSRSGDSAARV
jgi:hypothetical protein